ncbi:glycosyltransferase family 2 protein [Variovorax sp. VNK109]|uniref:glycosyltransferase family 2 protein n=1 Tax=Variovorax sp. VNK109 TaxID=3400919 RepID=UPI003C041779
MLSYEGSAVLSDRAGGGRLLRGTRSSSVEAPLITVITATYNAALYLPTLVASIRQQTYSGIEWIVMDAESTDGTIAILQSSSDVVDYWSSSADTGIYNAWNKALRHANGEWVCFLGADDYLWSSDAMARMAVALRDLPADVRIAYAQVMLLGRDDAPLYAVGTRCNSDLDRHLDVMKLPPHPGLMHRRAIFEQHGGFDESFRIAGDADLLFRELRHSTARFVPDLVIAGMRQGGISSKPSNVLRSLQELRRIQRKYGVRWPGAALTKARLRAYVRLILWGIVGERLGRYVLDAGRRVSGKPAYWTRT